MLTQTPITDAGGSNSSDWFTANAPTPVLQPGQTLNINTGQITSAPPPAVNSDNGSYTAADAAAVRALWAQSNQNPQAFVQAFVNAHGLQPKQSDPNSLLPIATALRFVSGQTYNVAPAGSGGYVKGFIGPDGNFIKVLDGSDRLIWDTSGNTSGGGGGIDPNTVGSLLAPFPGSFAPAAGTAPTLDLQNFDMPTGDEALKADPGYLFRADQGSKALLGNRAMQGILNSGGTAKDLIDYNQSAASQEFANFFDRSLSVNKTNNDNRTAIYNAQYKNYLDQYNMFRQRQQDTNQYLTDQQKIGIQANT